MTNLNRSSTARLAKEPTNKAGESPVHILIRVRSENGLTVTGHADVIAQRGAAMLGKFGQPIGGPLYRTLNQQIERWP